MRRRCCRRCLSSDPIWHVRFPFRISPRRPQPPRGLLAFPSRRRSFQNRPHHSSPWIEHHFRSGFAFVFDSLNVPSFFFFFFKYSLVLLWLTDYITQKKPLGGLLFLLPEVFNSENGRNKQIREKEKLNNVLAELEQLLIHANIPVSLNYILWIVFSWILYVTVLICFSTCNLILNEI